MTTMTITPGELARKFNDQEASEEEVEMLKHCVRMGFNCDDAVHLERVGGTVVRVFLSDGEEDTTPADNEIDLAPPPPPPPRVPWHMREAAEEDTTIFSTDPAWLLKSLKCDGGCGVCFKEEDELFTDGRDDFCPKCFNPEHAGLKKTTAGQRVGMYRADQLSMFNQLFGGFRGHD